MPLEPPPGSPWAAEEAFPALRFIEPVYLCAPPNGGDWLYVVERPGTIRRFRNNPDADQAEVFLDLTGSVKAGTRADNGLLCMAFHPEFGQEDSPNRNYFYVYYTTTIGGMDYYRLSRFAVTDQKKVKGSRGKMRGPGFADRMSETILIQQHDDHPIHNGGCLQFGPDGFLYISVGDEGGQGDPYETSQKIKEDLFSGILRIDVDRRGGESSHAPPRQPETGRTAHYYIPNQNPFVGVSGALEEFWAIGFRSPHRMSFDPVTGRLWLGEVGQNRWESIELIHRGSNHQWSYREGFAPYTQSYLEGNRPEPYYGVETWPVYQYPHANENRCIIGGYVYRGERFPTLNGKYVFGDLGSGRVWALSHEDGRATGLDLLVQLPHQWRTGPCSFGVDRQGEIYICVLGEPGARTGKILRLTRARHGRNARSQQGE